MVHNEDFIIKGLEWSAIFNLKCFNNYNLISSKTSLIKLGREGIKHYRLTNGYIDTIVVEYRGIDIER